MDDFGERPAGEETPAAEFVPKVQALADAAAGATSQALTADPDLDVVARLRQEMKHRGLNMTDNGWLQGVAEEIRAWQPGSVGGDNGGG